MKVTLDLEKSIVIEDDIDKIFDFIRSGDNDFQTTVFKALDEPIESNIDKALYFYINDQENIDNSTYLVIFRMNTTDPKGLRMVHAQNKYLVALFIEFFTTTSYEEALKTLSEGEEK